MARKSHISRLAAPKTWPIKRKGIKWIAKPLPGAHSLESSMPLLIYLRDLLGVAKTSKEAKKILSKGLVKINGKIIREEKFPVGIFDVIEIPSMKKSWRVIINQRGKLDLIEISSEEANLLPVKIVSKKTLKKNKIQFNFSNGWNLLNDNKDFKVGDVLLLNLKDKSVGKHLKFKEGSLVFITGGKHTGHTATLKGIKELGTLRKKKIAILQAGEETWQSPVEQLFVIGEKKPEVTLEK